MSSEADGTRTLLLSWRLLLWRMDRVVSHGTSMISFMVPVGECSKRDQVISISGVGGGVYCGRCRTVTRGDGPLHELACHVAVPHREHLTRPRGAQALLQSRRSEVRRQVVPRLAQ